MTNSRGVKALATAVLLLAAMSACSDDGNGPSATATPTPTSPAPTTTSSTPTPPTDSQIASEAASSVVREYFATVDLLGQDPSIPLRRLNTVATSIQLAAQKRLLQQQRGQGQVQTGDTTVSVLDVRDVNLDNSRPKEGVVPTVTIDVCWDVSGVDVVDGSGNSVVSPSRPDRSWTRYTVINQQWEQQPANGWRVASGQDLEKAPCAAS